MKKLLFMVVTGIVVAAMIRCTPKMDAPATVSVTGITINSSGDVSIEVGQTITFSVNITPTNATNKKVAWSSLNTGIATIDAQTGVVTGVSAGIATIRATAADGSGVTANKSITITAPAFGQGNGTEGNPYIITTPEQLDAVRNNLSAHYKLGQDIDLTSYLAPGGAGYTKWSTAGWEPIGNALLTSFTGSFNGVGYIITGLWINRSSADYIGLFGYILNGSVQNLGVEIAIEGIIGGNNTGGIAGSVTSSNASIINCYSTGTVSGNSSIGGITGFVVNGGGVINCYSASTVSGSSSVGGVVGSVANSNSSVINCYATGTITSTGSGTNISVGGVVGIVANSASITNCYAIGSVTGTGIGIGNSVGGVAGIVTNSASITNSVALNPSVSGNILVGRMVGSATGGGILSNSWARSMTVTVNGAFKTLDKGNDKVDGTDIPFGSENTEEWWKIVTNWNTTPPASAWKFGSNNDNPWKWGTTISGSNYTLPILYWQTTAPAVTNVTSIIIDPSGDISVEVGKTTILTATVTPTYATNTNVTWSSLNTGIATIDAQTGVVTGISIGTASIRATATDGSGVIATKNVTVSLFGQGNGTQENPYIILTSEQLDAMRNKLSAHYKLGQDIDLTSYLTSGGAGYTKWGTAGWEPVGSNQPTGWFFSGSLDGAGHKIIGLWINRPTTGNTGLFGYVSGGNVQNLGLEIAIEGIVGNSRTGGMIGCVIGSGSSIINCYVTGNISGNKYVGGVAGEVNLNSNITNSYIIGNVRGSDSGVGGVAGRVANGSSLLNCYVTGNVSGSNYSIGGVAGEFFSSSVTNCVALNLSITISGVSANLLTYTGRVVGTNDSGTLSNNWAQSNMTVTANGTPKPFDKGDDKVDGADCDTTPLASWWTNASPSGPGWNLSGTTANPWKWSNALSRPVLYWQ